MKYISGRKEIPVFLGASVPLTGILVQYFPEVHGKVGLGPIIPPEIPLSNLSHEWYLQNYKLKFRRSYNYQFGKTFLIGYVIYFEFRSNAECERIHLHGWSLFTPETWLLWLKLTLRRPLCSKLNSAACEEFDNYSIKRHPTRDCYTWNGSTNWCISPEYTRPCRTHHQTYVRLLL